MVDQPSDGLLECYHCGRATPEGDGPLCAECRSGAEAPKPEPVTSPDGLMYWDGRAWVSLPSSQSRWDGHAWRAQPPQQSTEWDGQDWIPKPSEGESRWNGSVWVVRPVGRPHEWNGVEWVPQPANSPGSKWTGRAWSPRPEPAEDHRWNGTDWVRRPDTGTYVWTGMTWRRTLSPRELKRILAIIGVLALVVVLSGLLGGGIRYLRSVQDEQAQEQQEQAQATAEQASLDGQAVASAKREDQLLATLESSGCQFLSINTIDCSGADLTGADLEGIDLSGADLSEATLQAARLVDALLVGANLANANLSGANLTRASLQAANVEGANFTGADLTAVTPPSDWTGAICSNGGESMYAQYCMGASTGGPSSSSDQGRQGVTSPGSDISSAGSALANCKDFAASRSSSCLGIYKNSGEACSASEEWPDGPYATTRDGEILRCGQLSTLPGYENEFVWR